MTRGSNPVRDRTLPGAIAALLAAGVLGGLAGSLGVVAGVALLGVWYALGPVYAFAMGQVTVAAVAGDWPPVFVAGGELAVFAVLFAPDVASSRGRGLVAWTIGFAVVLGAIASAAHLAWETTWATAVVLATVALVVGYGLHRYELVATGAVEHTGEATARES